MYIYIYIHAHVLKNTLNILKNSSRKEKIGMQSKVQPVTDIECFEFIRESPSFVYEPGCCMFVSLSLCLCLCLWQMWFLYIQKKKKLYFQHRNCFKKFSLKKKKTKRKEKQENINVR